jgi:fructokinase
MIASIGESLIDFTPVSADGRLEGFRIHPGGSPYNVAIGIARLGHPAAFAGRLSSDLFGRLLVEHLAESGVATHLAPVGTEPTALAFVGERDGETEYDFRLDGTAAAVMAPEDLPAARFAGLEAVHIGSFALALQPSREVVLGLARELHGLVPITLDPNWRSGVAADEAAYRAALAEAFDLADLVRASEADLRAADLPAGGPPGRPLIVTAGAAGSRLHLDGRVLACPAAPCRVVDTVGAGDAYLAGLLVALAERGPLHRAALAGLGDAGWLEAMRFASVAAALTCERAGADPPRRLEVEARLGAWPD